MDRSRLALVLFGLATALQGCVDVDSDLNVLPHRPLVLNGESGAVTIPPGKHPIQISIAKSSGDASEVAFKDLDQKFSFHLPDAEKLLSSVEPVVISSRDLGQPVTLTLTRTTDVDEDNYSLTLSSADNSSLIANADFKYKSDSVAYDDKTESFLLSFQDVRRSQRGALVTIDGGGPEPMNSIVNHSAQVLLAPWLYARYSDVQWILSEDEDDDTTVHAAWSDLIDSSPVIDYFAFDHSGGETWMLRRSAGLPLKKYQLRLVYTEGCGSASSNAFLDLIRNYNVAVGIGHRDTSASPFFAFPLVHSWTYGESALDSAEGGRSWGSAYAIIGNTLSAGTVQQMGGWKSQDDMLKESELGLEWTSEMPPEKLDIETSAVETRDTPEKRVISLSFIDSFGKDVQQFKDGQKFPVYQYVFDPGTNSYIRVPLN